MERHSKNRKREIDQSHDRHGTITKKILPLNFFPPFTGGRYKAMDNVLKYKDAAMKTTDLRKESRLRDKHYTSFSSSFRSHFREELLHSCRQDRKRLNYDKKRRNFAEAKGIKRPLLLPPLPARTFPEQNAKQANEVANGVKKTKSQKLFPKYLPKIETRKPELNDLNLVSPGTTNAEKTENQKLLPPLIAKRTVKPLRAAISSSATRRGLITLDLEEQFILRFRLSNYDVKDINTATLNEPV
ncbi:hypothetical protein ACROYT_G039972 [Oculina patagonica]